MPASIFVNYRRSDAGVEARAIYEHLAKLYGQSRVFIDINFIKEGSDFRKVLDQHLRRCRALVAIIGPNWMEASDENGHRRLDDPDDFVRVEIGTAIDRGITVIPVLVNGAPLPHSNELPDDLGQLCFQQAATVTTQNFAEDIRRLGGSLGTHVGRQVIDRVSLSVASGVGILTAFIALFSGLFAVGAIYRVAETLYPAIPGHTENTTMGARENVWILLLPLIGVVCLGTFGAAWTLERRFRNIGKLLGTVVSYSVILGVSIVNFLFEDNLINVNAQFLIDLVVIGGSLYLLFFFWTTNAETTILRVAKSLLLGIVLICGIFFPALFAFMFTAVKINLIKDFHLSISNLIALIAGMLGLFGGLLTYLKSSASDKSASP